MKRKFSAILLALPLFAFAPVTLAAVGNSDTGAGSENITSVRVHNEVTVVNDNNGTATNDVHVDASTGGNKILDNRGGFVKTGSVGAALENSRESSINTGDASADIKVKNSFNSNVTTIGKVKVEEEVDTSPEEGVTPTPTPEEDQGVSPAGGEESGVAAAGGTLPEAGTNTPIAALIYAIGALGTWGLLRLRAKWLVS